MAFTPGSAMWQGRSFLEASAEACRLLGRRGVLLTRHREQVPADLPPGVVHADYAPFSELLPRSAGWDVRVLATDLSQAALSTARGASYGSRSLQQVSGERLARFFVPQPDGSHTLRSEVTDLVELRQHNLVQDAPPAWSWTMPGGTRSAAPWPPGSVPPAARAPRTTSTGSPTRPSASGCSTR